MDAVRGDYALEFSHIGDQDHVKCSASVTYRAVCNERIVRFSQHSLQQTWSERLRLREGTDATGTRAKYFPKSHTNEINAFHTSSIVVSSLAPYGVFEFILSFRPYYPA